jgi:putative ABC transport system permease protein
MSAPSSNVPGLRFFEALYRRLAWLYPDAFRRTHGTEAVEFFRDRYRTAYRQRGWTGALGAAIRAHRDLIVSALFARWDDRPFRRSGSPGWPSREGVATTARDAVYAVRTLWRAPGFAVIAVATLALGIGANTAIFSVVNGVLLRPLPYPEPDRLVNVWQINHEWLDSPDPRFRNLGAKFPVSAAVTWDWVERATALESVGAFNTNRPAMGFGDRVEQMWTAEVTSGVFDALAIPPHLGRVFIADDDRIGAPLTAVLSHGFWQRQFDGDSAVIGRTVTLDGDAYAVIGVMPDGFYFPDPSVQVWTSMEDEAKQGGRTWQFLQAVGRLRPGLSLATAQLEMEAMNVQLQEDTAGEHKFGVLLVPRTTEVVGDVQRALLVLIGAVGLVLLIACANIANLLLVRATARRRELAVRAALGASRGRVMGQLLTESLVIGLMGGLVGLGLAVATFKPLLAFLPSSLPRTDEIFLDQRVLLFSLVASLATGILVGVLPALSVSRTGITDVLREGGRGFTGSGGRRRAHSLLVSSEIALAFALLVGSGLLVKSFVRLTTIERGFDAANVSMIFVTLRGERYADAERRNTFLAGFQERLAALPGALSVGFADNMPFGGGTSSTTMTVETATGPQEVSLQYSAVSADFFDALGIPVLAGRLFSDADRAGSPPVVIISEGAAREMWPDEDPVGLRMRRGYLDATDEEWKTIVGVVPDTRHRRLDIEPRPKYYEPVHQVRRTAYIAVIKTQGDPNALSGAARNILGELDPTIPVPRVATLEQQIANTVAMPRFRTLLVTMLAALAGLLAVVGIYGVMAYATAQRTSEIGVRIALGAQASDVVGDVLKRGAVLAGIGLTVGAGLAFAAVRVLDNLLYQTNTHDPAMFVGAGIVLGVAALLASYVPARRATRVDPVEALRTE